MSNTDSNSILNIKELSLRIGEKNVLNNINLQFNRGEAVLIVGSNGSGKSSLLRCIAGVYFPDSGSIQFPQNVTKKKIGFISDKMSLFEDMTLKQGIRFHCSVFDIPQFNDRLLTELNIDMNKPIKGLSNGERAIYHLSLLISQKPQILMVDEIIHAIDPYLREYFLEAVIELIDECNTTVIMVNHTISEIALIPERVLILEDGNFILDEKSENLIQNTRKIITNKPLNSQPNVIYTRQSSVYDEHYVYPFTDQMASLPNVEYQEIQLTEIIKSFIGGYYAKKRR